MIAVDRRTHAASLDPLNLLASWRARAPRPCCLHAKRDDKREPTWTPKPFYTATPTATLIPAATPTNVPAGWTVLDVHDFSIAFPQGSKHDYFPQGDGSILYTIQPAVKVIIQEHQVTAVINESYCTPNTPGLHPVTFAGLPMIYGLVGEEGGNKRDWMFIDAQGTSYELIADDTTASSDIQAQDDAILATVRPANTPPWPC